MGDFELIEAAKLGNDGDAGTIATPAGGDRISADMGGFLGIELDDFAYAIRRGDVDWVARFTRFPTLRGICDVQGKLFTLLAEQSSNPEITRPFGSEADSKPNPR